MENINDLTKREKFNLFSAMGMERDLKHLNKKQDKREDELSDLRQIMMIYELVFIGMSLRELEGVVEG